MNLRPSLNGGIAAALTALLIPIFNLIDVFDIAELSEDKQQAITSLVAVLIPLILALTGNKPKPAED